MMRMYKMFKKEEGFTLVELMVVVLIIGILVAIAIPVYNSVQRNARNRACQSNQRTIDGAIQQWVAAETGRVAASVAYPADLVDEFIAVEPKDPATDNSYVVTAGEVQGCPNDAAAAEEKHDNYRTGAP